jgi:SsrA-binding protein
MKKSNLIARNKRARGKYDIREKFEAGIVLNGGEIKSVRQKKININDAYAKLLGGELWLINAHIAQYQHDSSPDYDPRRSRKLLIKKAELNHLIGKLQRGLTLIPLSMYLTRRGIAKIKLGLAKGRKIYDKRALIKEKDLRREQSRELKNRPYR